MRFFSAGDWARRVNGKRFDSGELVKREYQHRLPTGFQSYVLNTRRELFKDVRVRQALGLALDYEWLNRQLFYNAYQRVNGLFGNTDCQATGSPSPQELALLAPWRSVVPPEVFGPMTQAPRTDAPRTDAVREPGEEQERERVAELEGRRDRAGGGRRHRPLAAEDRQARGVGHEDGRHERAREAQGREPAVAGRVAGHGRGPGHHFTPRRGRQLGGETGSWTS